MYTPIGSFTQLAEADPALLSTKQARSVLTMGAKKDFDMSQIASVRRTVGRRVLLQLAMLHRTWVCLCRGAHTCGGNLQHSMAESYWVRMQTNYASFHQIQWVGTQSVPRAVPRALGPVVESVGCILDSTGTLTLTLRGLHLHTVHGIETCA